MISPRELNQMMQSDNKLWERSSTVEEGGVLTKSIELPHGIGLFTISFEGVKDAAGRRNAAGIWGESIRDAVNDAIGDEAVTARAAQRAATISEDTGGIISSSGSNTLRPEQVSQEEAVPTLSTIATGGAASSDRLHELLAHRAALEGTVEDTLKRIKGLDLEIKALEAYMEVMNAQEVQTGTPEESEEGVISEALPDREPES